MTWIRIYDEYTCTEGYIPYSEYLHLPDFGEEDVITPFTEDACSFWYTNPEWFEADLPF